MVGQQLTPAARVGRGQGVMAAATAAVHMPSLGVWVGSGHQHGHPQWYTVYPTIADAPVITYRRLDVSKSCIVYGICLDLLYEEEYRSSIRVPAQGESRDVFVEA